MSEYEGAEPILVLCWKDKSSSATAELIERPIWESIEEGLFRTFKEGGFVRLDVNSPKSSYIRQLMMNSQPGKFRLTALTRSKDFKEEYLEWWGLKRSEFCGMSRFGDDEWDSRTVCTDISVAAKIFKEVYEKGDLISNLCQMRSPWYSKL